jgi:hypothetical protein
MSQLLKDLAEANRQDAENKHHLLWELSSDIQHYLERGDSAVDAIELMADKLRAWGYPPEDVILELEEEEEEA